MKKAVVSVICLLVGLAIGFFAGYRYYERDITNEAVHQMIQTMDSGNRLDTASAVRAIEIIQSGQTQEAVRFLCRPIADYYYMYSSDADTNDERVARLRIRIQQLMSTNTVVAEEMTNRKTNY